MECDEYSDNLAGVEQNFPSFFGSTQKSRGCMRVTGFALRIFLPQFAMRPLFLANSCHVRDVTRETGVIFACAEKKVAKKP